MDIFQLAEIQSDANTDPASYTEFLRRPSMSAGIYRLCAGTDDPQQPHKQDEIYYVISGDAQIEIAGESRSVGSGSIIFVAADVEHRFHNISNDLELLVLFAPAEQE